MSGRGARRGGRGGFSPGTAMRVLRMATFPEVDAGAVGTRGTPLRSCVTPPRERPPPPRPPRREPPPSLAALAARAFSPPPLFMGDGSDAKAR